MKHISRSLLIFLLCLLHMILGINGLVGGLLMVIKPDGSLLGMQTDWLNRSPFADYLIPGFLLFIFIGIIPLVTFLGLIIKRNWRLPNFLNIYPDRHWAWSYSIYTGIIAIFWITIQLILTQYFWIQPVIITIGLFIIIISMIPEVMDLYELNRKD